MTDYVLLDNFLREEIFIEVFDESCRDINRIIDLLSRVSVKLDTDGSAIYTEDEIEQVKFFLGTFGRIEDPSWRYCAGSVFVLYMLRNALKSLKLPLTKANNWKPLAKKFTKMMAEV